jgi:hypothetical protein
VTAVGCGGDRTYSGTVVTEPQPVMGVQGRWILTVRLDGDEILGTNLVQVGFNEAEMSCRDSTVRSPSDVAVGTLLTFTRVGEAETSSPPIVGGRELRLDCADEDR